MSRTNNRGKLISLLGMANVKDFPNSEELNAIITLHNQLVANSPKRERKRTSGAKKTEVKAEGEKKGFAVRKPTGETIAMVQPTKKVVVEEKKVEVPETEVTL